MVKIGMAKNGQTTIERTPKTRRFGLCAHMTRQAAALFPCERMPVLSAVQSSGGAMTAAERSVEADFPVSDSRGPGNRI